MKNTKLKIWVFGVLFFVFLNSLSAYAWIYEVNYNPEGNDNNKEYIEVIVNSWKNIDGWTIEDGDNSTDTLELIAGNGYGLQSVFENGDNSSDTPRFISSCGYNRINIIVEEGFNLTGLDLNVVNVYSAGKSIGNGLGNSGDSIKLYDLRGNLMFNAEYNGSVGNGNGNSVCFMVNGTAYECEHTPGERNSPPF